ncbi:O-antigen ligase family protein [Pedobacter heparinus]|uniref:O-antigen ligase family protein n=1 Tax=Pedobacter heparinus TaxID=984 RepID=UPI00292F6294|nr:O-antigen ligase family protein [Pedobacter heparinus]
MKMLKRFILLLILCNLPGYSLVQSGATLGSLLSYSTFLAIIAYYFLAEKEKPVIQFVILGIGFSLISLLVDAQYSDTFLVTFTKYLIVIIMLPSLIKDLKPEEVYVILLVGCSSIIYEAVFVSGIGGRYSGVYLNANLAAYSCIFGYAFGLSIKNKRLKLIGQLLFSIGGLVTFSRTFLLIWVLINLLSILLNYKNVYKIFVCIGLFALFITFGDRFDLNTQRLTAFSDILSGKIDAKMKEGARTETWALYYDKILSHPLWGSGYKAFSGQTAGGEIDTFTVRVGVHNTFLMIIGEAGIFVFLLFLWIYGYLLVNGIYFFKKNPSIFFITFSLILFMMTLHNYFDNYLVLFTSLWLYHETSKMKNYTWNRGREIVSLAENPAHRRNEILLGQYHLN